MDRTTWIGEMVRCATLAHDAAGMAMVSSDEDIALGNGRDHLGRLVTIVEVGIANKWIDAEGNMRPVPAEQHAPEHVTDEELAEVERLDREATPGPWAAGDIEEGDALTVYDASDEQRGAIAECMIDDEDAKFIALARTLLPRLAAAERARRAPVDVAAVMSRRRDEIESELRQTQLGGGVAPILATALADMAVRFLRPHVERAAVLAREVSAWRAYDKRQRRMLVALREERDVLAREAEGLRTALSAMNATARLAVDDVASMRVELDTARAEIERLKGQHHCEAPSCCKPADGVTCSPECAERLTESIQAVRLRRARMMPRSTGRDGD